MHQINMPLTCACLSSGFLDSRCLFPFLFHVSVLTLSEDIIPLLKSHLLAQERQYACPALYIDMDKTQVCPAPCAIAGVRRKATQLRDELVTVSEQQCCAMLEPHTHGNQLKLALGAMDEVISKLQECENIRGNSAPMERQEPSNATPLSMFERASILQSWDMKRKRQELKQNFPQQQKAVKR